MKKLKYALLGLLGILGAFLVWGVAIEPYRIDVEEEVAEIPNLPPSWQGQQVALISDFQVGMWLDNTSTIRRVVNRLVEAPPALVLIAGDFVYQPDANANSEIEQVVELLRPLTAAQIPTYAVLGNHDYASENSDTDNRRRSSKLQTALEAIDIQVLQNEAVVLGLAETGATSRDGSITTDQQDTLYLVGIGAHRPDEDQPVNAIEQVPSEAARLVLMHNPASFAELPPDTAPLAMAGHTHGGQIRIPLTPEWTWMSLLQDDSEWNWIAQIRGDDVRVAGWIKGYGESGNHLYINRGIGFSLIPVRFNCPPEITRFTLRSFSS
jgi:predicted MPP superfamily phosphohydrolase